MGPAQIAQPLVNRPVRCYALRPRGRSKPWTGGRLPTRAPRVAISTGTTPMRRYDQSIRVITAFFAALLGFGLKNLLDNKSLPSDMPAPCFILSVLLFLRFILGSANHYWYDYVNTDT